MTLSNTLTSRDTDQVTRRKLLGVIGSLVATSAVASSSGAAQESSADFGGWFDNVSNYDGIVDKTGVDQVMVKVGTEANNGNFGFGPAAVRISTGTTVVWEWTGKGGSHNVVDSSKAFESELTAQAGHRFSYTFEKEGVYKYFCIPHKALGMKGAVVVGDVSVSESTSASTSGGDQNGGVAAKQSTEDSFKLSQVSIQNALMVTLLGTAGLAAFAALIPDIGVFASTASRPASRTGYVIHRLNRFRDSWVFSVIVGWLSFFAILVALGALFVALWYVGGGTIGFLAGLVVGALVIAWYVITSTR